MTGATANTTTIDNDDVAAADAIVQATTVASNLKRAIKTLIMREQADVLTCVLRRLNGDEDGKNLETVKREPSVLIAMLLEEHSKRLQEELLVLGEEKKENNGDD